MRILHVVPSSLPDAAARAIAYLVDEQRNFGHVASVVYIDGDTAPMVAGGAGDAWSKPGDVLHAHGARAAATAGRLMSGTARRRPLVVTLHDWLHDAQEMSRSEIQQVYALAGRIVVPAGTAAVTLLAQGLDPQRIRVIPYPIGQAPEPGAAQQPLLREMVDWRNRGGDVVCAVAHGVGLTHHRTVLSALAMLPHRDATLCVLAGDVDEGACTLHARSLGLESQVRIVPASMDPRPVASRVDAVILPAFDERRPFALAEVWCDGVPVLAGRNPQFTDLDGQGGGTLFYEPGDAQDLARALATVRSTTPAGRRLLVDRARMLYRLRFTGQAVLDAYLAEYQALLGARQSVA